MTNEEAALTLFVDAIKLTDKNLFIDAINAFTNITHQFPESELADDALFNAGLCHFHLNSFVVAINTFRSVINNYPAADIYTYGNHREFGKTAAKCHYAIIHCYLGLAQPDFAIIEMKELAKYPDSYTESELGEKVTFIDLAKKAIDTYSLFDIA